MAEADLSAPGAGGTAHACEQLVYWAGHCTDYRLWDELASLFAETGRLIRPSDPTHPIIGRSSILASLRARPPRTTRHSITNVMVHMHSTTRARVSSQLTLFSGPARVANQVVRIGKIAVGNFEDELEWSDDRWHFLVRDGSISMEMDLPFPD